MELRARRDPMALRARRDPMVLLVLQDRMELLVLQVHRAPPELTESLVLTELPAQLVHKAQLVLQERPVHRDHQESQDLMV